MAEDAEKTIPKDDEVLKPKNALSRFAEKIHARVHSCFYDHPVAWKWIRLATFNVILVVHFSFATWYFVTHKHPHWDWKGGYGMLIILLVIVYVVMFYQCIYKPFVREPAGLLLAPFVEKVGDVFSRRTVSWVLYLVILSLILVFLVWDCFKELNRLIALAGFFAMLLFGFVFSKYPGEIKARPVFCGLFTQFFLGLTIIKWRAGREVFQVAGDKVATFLGYADAGARFVYGESVMMPPTFAFKALSVIFFLSFMVQILYYYDVLQRVVKGLGMVLQRAMGTTIVESVNAAANIFMGMTEAPLLLQPYLSGLTTSELHAVMAAGFATVAGTVLAAYINYGAKAAHLITASVLNAPTALCFSKIFYPETEESRSTGDTLIMPRSEAQGVLDAACQGASAAIALVLNIVANVVAFVTFITFIDALVGWFGGLVGVSGASLVAGLSYGFAPLTFLMGVPWNETLAVGRLIAVKTTINEFVAYSKMGELNRVTANSTNIPLTKRATAIATFALCGFANPGSIGIMVSSFSILVPSKREDVMDLVWRSFITGMMSCFLSACIAGMLMSEADL